MIILSHPTGNANVRAVGQAFAEAKILLRFHTSIASFPDGLMHKLGTWRPLGEITRRSFIKELKPFTCTWPWLEIGRLFASKAQIGSLTFHETGPFCIDEVYKSIDIHVSRSLRKSKSLGASAIYAYEDGAITSFKSAKTLGIKCFYDLPIGYWRTAHRLLEIEREIWPEWGATLTGLKDSQEKLLRKDEELILADRIFVASKFTARTLYEFPGKLAPVEVIPYGFPPVGKARQYLISPAPLKLLFVGSLSQRKGIANLFAAVEALGKHVKLTVIGQKVSENCPVLDKALSKHNWIPSLPHDKILETMRKNDVLIFPSLFEGFGLVITEAMSQGTPVITTERTAGPDLIQHGENGWLTKAGSTSALIETIEELLSNPSLIKEAGHLAMETARLRPWEKYGHEIVQSISNFKKQGNPERNSVVPEEKSQVG